MEDSRGRAGKAFGVRGFWISRKRIVAGILVVAVILGGFGVNRMLQGQKAPVTLIQRVPVSRGSVKGVVSTTGQTLANITANLTFVTASGDARERVAEIYVQEGDQVKKDQRA